MLIFLDNDLKIKIYLIDMVRIERIEDGKIVVDGKEYFSDAILWWNGRIEQVEKFNMIDHNHMLMVMEKGCRIIVIVYVHEEVMVTDAAKEIAREKGIELFVEPADKGRDVFNAFIADRKQVVAFVHVN